MDYFSNAISLIKDQKEIRNNSNTMICDNYVFNKK